MNRYELLKMDEGATPAPTIPKRSYKRKSSHVRSVLRGWDNDLLKLKKLLDKNGKYKIYGKMYKKLRGR